MQVPLSRPDITDLEISAVEGVLRSPFLSMGVRVEEFESAIADYVGSRYGIAVNSGTSGLHLLVRAFDIGEGDQVITTPFSFVASSNCILYERAQPVFVDIEPQTLNLDSNAVEAAITPRTKAILVVDAFGHPARLDEVKSIAERHGLKVIEDSCESLGSQYKGLMAGNPAYCDGAVFAFYPNKQITTGEGGMIVTADEETARLCRSMRNQGRGEANVWLSHERLGYNYRLDEMSAALGVAQMQRIDEILAKRARVAAEYEKHLSRLQGVRLPRPAPEVDISWFVYVIRLDEHISRDGVMQYLLDNGVGCRPYFTPIHLQPFYREQFGYREGDFPETERAGRTCLAIPFYNNLTEVEMDYVVENLRRAIELYQE